MREFPATVINVILLVGPALFIEKEVEAQNDDVGKNQQIIRVHQGEYAVAYCGNLIHLLCRMVSDDNPIIFKVHNGGKKDCGDEQIDRHVIAKLPFGGEAFDKGEQGPDKRNLRY
ncbi:hypothetical protein D3C75_579610 [compost metagenome]